MSLAVLVPATSTRLTTVAAVLARLPTADVALVDALIEGASAAIVQHTHRVWGLETVAETLPGSGSRYLGLSRAPVLSVGTVTEDAGTVTDYSVADAAAASLYRFDGWGRSGSRMWETLSYSSGYLLPGSGDLRYVVSYTAGYVLPGGTVTATLPADVQLAATETVKAWYQRTNQDVTITRKQVGDVSVSYGQVATTAPHTLPPVAEALLRPWVRQSFEPGR
jgi:hypothetical protein